MTVLNSILNLKKKKKKERKKEESKEKIFSQIVMSMGSFLNCEIMRKTNIIMQLPRKITTVKSIYTQNIYKIYFSGSRIQFCNLIL